MSKFLRYWHCIKIHRCRKSKTYQLLNLIPNVSNLNSHNLVVQKYELATETHKMKMVLVMGLCNSLLYKARIGHKNTYDMRVKIHRCRKYNTYQ